MRVNDKVNEALVKLRGKLVDGGTFTAEAQVTLKYKKF